MSKAISRSLAVVLCFSFCALFSAVTFAQKIHAKPPAKTGETKTGIWRGRLVTYQVIDGRDIYQGDIILDNVQPVTAAGMGGVKPDSIGIAYSQYMWPKVGSVYQIPYIIDPASGDVANINSAITAYNSDLSGVIQLVAHTTEANYIDINMTVGDESGECEATEGDAHVGEQMVTGSEACTVATILHEFGHVTGLWHEQSRSDRNTYVTVNYSNVIKGSWGNFEQVYDDAQELTPFDYASVMEYPAFSFTRNGGPVIESIPPGIPLSNLVGYSAADIEGIERLYGAPPSKITVTSNPPGLSVIVDGSTITTPQTFTWALNSTHTVNIPSGVQTVMGNIVDSDPPQPTNFYYNFGVWSDGGATSHMITVTPGNGDLPFPVTSPQVSTYSANFIQLVPYTYTVAPASSGSVVASPVAQSYTGVEGVYFVARQLETLTATPNSTYQFYDFNNGPFYLPGGTGANPKEFYVPDTGLYVDPVVDFTKSPVYHVDISPDPFSSNLYVLVDGTFWYTPKNFSPDTLLDGSSWGPSTEHILTFQVPQQYPYSINSRYSWDSWNAGTPDMTDPYATDIVTPAAPPALTNYIATVTPQFAPANNFQPCGGTASFTPSSEDGFYPTGQILHFSATPSTNWTFAGWTFDLTGTTNPDNLTAADETLVYANFNTTDVPLTLTSISPSTALMGGPAFTLTMTGTGFTNPGSNVGLNFPTGPFLTATSITSTQIQMTVPSSAIAAPGAFQVYVENYPTGWTGCANFGFQTFLVAGAPVVAPTPTSLTFGSQAVGTTSPAQSVTVKNTGTVNTTISVAPSGDFAIASSPVNTCTGNLTAGGNCTFGVTFTPSATGTRTGSVTITDQAANSPQMVGLTGTGISGGSATITLTPTSESFTATAVGSSSATKVITVKNTGAVSTPISISPSGDFTESNTCGSTLNSGSTCTITAGFTPTVTGSISGAITVSDNASNSPQIASLTGSGLAPLTFSPATLAFGNEAVGSTTASKIVMVTNNESAALGISFAASANYAVDATGTTCTSSLGSKAKCNVAVTFTPSSPSSIDGDLIFTYSGAYSPLDVKLTGKGTGGATEPLKFTPASLTFPKQAIGTTSAAKTITVKNSSASSVTLSSISAAGNFVAVGSGGTPCGGALAAGASCTISVTFTPSSAAAVSGAVVVADTGSDSPQIVNLSGTGVLPVTIAPTSLTFPSTNVGSTSAAQTLTITNNLTATLSSLSFAASGDFSVAPGGGTPCGSSIAAGGSCTVSVTFKPSTTGSIKGAVTVTNSASTSPQTVKLTGTGAS